MAKSNIEKSKNAGISAYTSVWVVFKYGDTDINQIYLKLKDAENVADERTKEYFKYYRQLHKNLSNSEFDIYFKNNHKNSTWKATLLDDAISQIKEYVKENVESSHDC